MIGFANCKSQTRIIFRLAEFSSGPEKPSTLTTHEAPFYILEAIPMLAALMIFNIIHPGVILRGPDSEMPGLWSLIRRRRSKQREAHELGLLNKSTDQLETH